MNRPRLAAWKVISVAALAAALALPASGWTQTVVSDRGGELAAAAKKKCKKKAKKKCRKKRASDPAAPVPATPPPVAASLSIDPTSHDFGFVDVLFTPHHNKTFTVTNSGGSASGSLLTSVSGPNADKFPISNDTCNGNSLGAGASCTLVITFTPTGAADTGPRSATLNVSASPGGILAAPLSAEGFV